jgi:Flp pilus assembly protein TadG
MWLKHVCRNQLLMRNTAALRTFRKDERGAAIVIIGLTMPVLIGAMGLATEVSYWQWLHRGMQNAADAAAIAAATNAASNYDKEAKAVAAQYGFQDLTNNISVTVANPATAPGCSANCYTVTISRPVQLFLASVIGYGGNTTVNNKPASTISASSVASTANAYTYCILALGSSGAQGIRSDGAPKANLNGCNLMSNTDSTCNGSNLYAAYGDAHGTNNGCGASQNSNVPAVSDPFSGLASNIPNNICGGSYPQEPTTKNASPLPSLNQWSGNYTFAGGSKVVCGDQQLTGNTTINEAVLVIVNGQLDTNGYTLQGSDLTIVFTGSNTGNYQHVPSGSGTLDIAAPTSGDWSGVAMYQDPNLTKNVDISAAGNTPTWNISGLVYLPHSSVTFSGAVSKSSHGVRCFELVVDNVTINGTGSIFANDDQCASAGLAQTQGGHRGTLVN